jgi:hypothetical protein
MLHKRKGSQPDPDRVARRSSWTVMALIENGEEVPAEAFALLPAEIRQGGMLLMLGVIMQAVTA